MDKSPEAFRTISEVAEWLDVPTHVLRFWESRFAQVKPVKRAGGRRYYRPADMALLGGIKKLLHEDGLTIRGVQKVLREQGVKHVASLAPSVDGGTPSESDGAHIGAATPPLPEPAAMPREVVADTPPEAAAPQVPVAASPAEPDAGDNPDAALMRFPFFDDPPEPEPPAEQPETPAPQAAPDAFVADVSDTDPEDDDPSVAIRGALPLMTAPAMAQALRSRRDELLALQGRLSALQARRRGQSAPTDGA